MSQVNAIPNILLNICFTEECSLFLNGNVNRQNCGDWSDKNPNKKTLSVISPLRLLETISSLITRG